MGKKTQGGEARNWVKDRRDSKDTGENEYLTWMRPTLADKIPNALLSSFLQVEI